MDELTQRPSLSGRRKSTTREDATNLTPREVVELARETSQAQANYRAGRPGSYGEGRGPAAGMGDGEMEPVEFVPLTDDLLLPFDDRSSEMEDLMQADANQSLFKLISLSFPSTASDPDLSVGLSAPPTEWTYKDLKAFLILGRDRVGDREWVRKVGIAVKSKSEALWEKLKGCLGFDEDDDFGIEGEGADEEREYAFGPEGGEEERVWIEGLVEGEGQPPLGLGLAGATNSSGAISTFGNDSEASFDSSDPHGDSIIVGAVGAFSPELSTLGLPGSSGPGAGAGPASHRRSLSMDIIGEAEEEEDASASGGSSAAPSRQSTMLPPALPDLKTPTPAADPVTSTPDQQPSKNFVSNLTATAPLRSPSNVTPRSSFSFHPSAPNSDDSVSPSEADTPSNALSRSPQTSMRVPSITATVSSPIDTPHLGDMNDTSLTAKQRSKSFVGVSIMSSSPAMAASSHPSTPGSSSGQPSYTSSPSFCMSPLSSTQQTPFYQQHPSSVGHSRNPSYHPDDHHYGGNELSDPMSERGPGSPLFPTSFANLSLKPIRRTSSLAGQGLASSVGMGSRAGTLTQSRQSRTSRGGLDVPGAAEKASRQWAREMIGTRGMQSLGSDSALTIGTPSEYSV